MTNLQEYLAGTSPRDSSSALRITSVTRSAEDIVVSFGSVFGKLYRIEVADDLNGPWNTLSDNLAGTGGSLIVNDTEAVDPSG